jgi:hypothetical protein
MFKEEGIGPRSWADPFKLSLTRFFWVRTYFTAYLLLNPLRGFSREIERH